MKVFDLCIIGGGPAGSLLGYLLSKKGHSVTLLESQTSMQRKVCGEYLCPKGVEILESLGLQGITTAARKIYGMRLFSPDGSSFLSDFPRSRTSGGRAIPRDILDQSLLEIAREAGVSVEMGKRVEQVTDEGNTWKVQAGHLAIRSRILVGADGRRSFVSKALQNETDAKSKRAAIHANIRSLQPTTQYGEMHILADGEYVGLNPTGESEWNLSLVCDAQKIKKFSSPKDSLERALASSNSLSERFLPLHPETSVKVTFPIRHFVQNISGHRWALVGDAAGFLDPLTGEGIYNALLSANLLANHLHEALSCTLVKFAPYLERYSNDMAKSLNSKRRLNMVFQWMIRRAWLCNLLARYFSRHKKKADIFIGMVGNLLSPTQGLFRLLF